MYDLKGIAFTGITGTSVQLCGLLEDTCTMARIVDKYPGGNIVYIVDPGVSQVFIEETHAHSGFFCLPVLTPWFGSVLIPPHDYHHKQVEVFVNGKSELKIDIQNVGSLAGFNEQTQSAESILPWQVIALVGADNAPYFGCSIIPKHAIFPAIYRVVFGGGSDNRDYQECQEFMKENCASL